MKTLIGKFLTVGLLLNLGTLFNQVCAQPIIQQAYLKASNTRAGQVFSYWSLAISGDTVVVGAPYEASSGTGVNGDQSNTNAPYSGAAYVFVRSGTNWSQQAYLKASNTGANDDFGRCVSIAGDTIVVGAPNEDSNSSGVNGNQSNNSATSAGAAYVFVRSGTNWSQQAYLKASNTDALDRFGWSVSVSGDTVVVGARDESSAAKGVNGNQADNSALVAGAAYVFVRSGTNWSQQAYLKASNTERLDSFGSAVAISGNTVAVAAWGENSAATGVNGDQNDTNAVAAGAVYVFARNGTTWNQQAYLKASNTQTSDRFGYRLALSGDTLVVSADEEDSAATGVNGNQTSNQSKASGAAYVFVRNGTNWSQQAYLKASNTESNDFFGASVAVSGDIVAVGAAWEASAATGVNGDQNNNNAPISGAAYVFVRTGTNWVQNAYLKASNAEAGDTFGRSVGVSGNTVVVGAHSESSNATGVNGDQANNDLQSAGAAYVFTGFCPVCPQLSFAPDANGGYLVRFNGIPGLAYRLERASSVTGPWSTIETLTAPVSGFVEFHDTAPLPIAAFYRAVQP